MTLCPYIQPCAFKTIESLNCFQQCFLTLKSGWSCSIPSWSAAVSVKTEFIAFPLTYILILVWEYLQIMYIQVKANDTYFPVALFIAMYKVD